MRDRIKMWIAFIKIFKDYLIAVGGCCLALSNMVFQYPVFQIGLSLHF